MKKYMIEREVPKVGTLEHEQLPEAAVNHPKHREWIEWAPLQANCLDPFISERPLVRCRSEARTGTQMMGFEAPCRLKEKPN